jgi:alkylhydroperoxidase/carboxymuconolactone decarboxylase family protein YurZ
MTERAERARPVHSQAADLAAQVLHARTVAGLITVAPRGKLRTVCADLLEAGATPDEIVLALATTATPDTYAAQRAINTARIARKAGGRQ